MDIKSEFIQYVSSAEEKLEDLTEYFNDLIEKQIEDINNSQKENDDFKPTTDYETLNKIVSLLSDIKYDLSESSKFKNFIRKFLS